MSWISEIPRGPIVSAVWGVTAEPINLPLQTRRHQPCPEAAPRVLRTADAARYLGVSPWTVRRLAAEGKLGFLPGKFLRFDREELDAFIAKEKVRL